MRFLIALMAMTLAASSASAHTGTMTAGGFPAGFLHPIGGLDHVLAMVTVGLLAFHVGGRATWLVPSSFISMMVVGGALGAAAIALPLVEFGIVLSIVVLGAMLASGRAMGTMLAVLIVGVFAVFHGHAHGAEMPAAASAAAYGFGLLVATALLHGAGLLAGYGLARLGSVSGTRLGPEKQETNRRLGEFARIESAYRRHDRAQVGRFGVWVSSKTFAPATLRWNRTSMSGPVVFLSPTRPWLMAEAVGSLRRAPRVWPAARSGGASTT